MKGGLGVSGTFSVCVFIFISGAFSERLCPQRYCFVLGMTVSALVFITPFASRASVVSCPSVSFVVTGLTG